MTFSALYKLFSPKPASFQERIDESLPRYRDQPSEDLVRQLHDSDYLSMGGAEPEGPSMADTPVVRRLFALVEAGDWVGLAADWHDTLTALVQAERSIGLTGRPMLIDADIQLTCIVQVMAERELRGLASQE